MLDDLVVAVESEAQVIDLSRVSTFMTRVSNLTLSLSHSGSVSELMLCFAGF